MWNPCIPMCIILTLHSYYSIIRMTWHQEHIKRTTEDVDLRKQTVYDLRYSSVQFAKRRGGGEPGHPAGKHCDILLPNSRHVTSNILSSNMNLLSLNHITYEVQLVINLYITFTTVITILSTIQRMINNGREPSGLELVWLIHSD